MLSKILKEIYCSSDLWGKNALPVVVVATDTEREIARKILGDEARIVQTGAGLVHAFEIIQNLPRKTPVFNFGYAGSNKLRVGEIVCVKHSWLHHPSVTFDKPDVKYNLKLIPDLRAVDCYTSSDFVTKTDIKDPVVFDMELAAICARFENVVSIKMISDSLDLDRYEHTVSKNNTAAQ